MSIAAILFDFDGVIADSETPACLFFSDFLTGHGMPTSADEAHERYIGRSRADNLASIRTHWGDLAPVDLAERIEAASLVAFRAPVPVVPGAAAFLDGTRHLPRGIASGSATALIRYRLDAFGFTGHFGDHVYSAHEHVTRGKPFPDLYLHAAAALGVPIETTVVIEDSPIGARAGRAAGARVLGLAAASHCRPSLTDALHAEGVERVFASYTDLAAYLDLAPLP